VNTVGVKDIMNSEALTVGGTPDTFAHPRIIYPSPAQIRRFGTATTPPAASTPLRMMMGMGT